MTIPGVAGAHKDRNWVRTRDSARVASRALIRRKSHVVASLQPRRPPTVPASAGRCASPPGVLSDHLTVAISEELQVSVSDRPDLCGGVTSQARRQDVNSYPAAACVRRGGARIRPAEHMIAGGTELLVDDADLYVAVSGRRGGWS